MVGRVMGLMVLGCMLGSTGCRKTERAPVALRALRTVPSGGYLRYARPHPSFRLTSPPLRGWRSSECSYSLRWPHETQYARCTEPAISYPAGVSETKRTARCVLKLTIIIINHNAGVIPIRVGAPSPRTLDV